MKRVSVLDDAAGNAIGWDPNGVDDSFFIDDINVQSDFETFVSVMVDTSIICVATDAEVAFGDFTIRCASPPPRWNTP
jgi:hypothetical protein